MSHLTAKNYAVGKLSIEKRAASGPLLEIVNEYDQEIPQSQTADNPVAP